MLWCGRYLGQLLDGAESVSSFERGIGVLRALPPDEVSHILSLLYTLSCQTAFKASGSLSFLLSATSSAALVCSVARISQMRWACSLSVTLYVALFDSVRQLVLSVVSNFERSIGVLCSCLVYEVGRDLAVALNVVLLDSVRQRALSVVSDL